MIRSKEAQSGLRKGMNRAKKNYEKSLTKEAEKNPKSFFSYIKTKKSSPRSRPHVDQSAPQDVKHP